MATKEGKSFSRMINDILLEEIIRRKKVIGVENPIGINYNNNDNKNLDLQDWDKWNKPIDKSDFKKQSMIESPNVSVIEHNSRLIWQNSYWYLTGKFPSMYDYPSPVTKVIKDRRMNMMNNNNNNNNNYGLPSSPRIKITDWGLGKDINRQSLALTARATDGQIGGTPGYCSPEQWFAFDGLMAEQTPSYDDKMNRPAVVPPSKYHHTISRKLDYCILKMVDLKPENRQQSIWDLIFELETLPDNY